MGFAQIRVSKQIDHGVGLPQQQHREAGPPREQLTTVDAIGARETSGEIGVGMDF